MGEKGIDLVEISINAIKKREYSIKAHTKESRKLLSISISSYGQTKPIFVREIPEDSPGVKFEIVDGQEVFKAIKRLKLETAKVINLGALSKNQAHKFYLAHNVDHSEKDLLSLSEVVKRMNDDGYSLKLIAQMLVMDVESVSKLIKLMEFDWEKWSIEEEGSTNDQLALF